MAEQLSSGAKRRLISEEKKISEDGTDVGFFAHPQIDENGERDYRVWDIYLKGSQDSLYDGYVLHAKIFFPTMYPLHPPKFIFQTEMYHPNVYKDGSVCISILDGPDDDPTNFNPPDIKWSPVYSIRTIVLAVMSVINEPDTSSPANIDAAKEFNTAIKNYNEKVRNEMKVKSLKVNNVLNKHLNKNEKDSISSLFVTK